MDNEMIERCKAELQRCFAPAIDFKAPYAKAMSDMAIKDIIKAMREPTEKMVEAALHDYMYREKTKQPWNGKVMYQTMIDTVIND